MSKGDKRRPEDRESYEDGYAKTFGQKKSVRGSFVWDKEAGKLVPKEDYYAGEAPASAMVLTDIQPYKSMATGEMITSRSVHREHLKRHQLIEVGNEVNYLKNSSRKQESPSVLKQRVIDIANSRLS